MKFETGNGLIELVEGDITELATDAIVNAANSGLILGAGVAGAIRSKGGPDIQAECNKIGGCPVGGAVMTGAGRLKAKYVIHAVGPRMGEGDEENKLRSATLSSLRVAGDAHLDSIAFPAISAGIFGFPIEKCALIMLNEAVAHLNEHSQPSCIVFCLFGRDAYSVFEETLKNV